MLLSPVSRIFFLILILMNNSTLYSQDFGTLPFKQCWAFPINDMSKTGIASDNGESLFVALADGTIEAITKSDGKIAWKAEIGGDITSQLFFEGTKLIVVTNSSEPGKNTMILRAISQETGIPSWQIEFENQTPVEWTYLLSDQSKIFLVTQTGVIHSIDKQTGRLLGQHKAVSQFSSYPKLSSSKIYVGSFEKSVFVYSILTGEITETINVPAAPSVIEVRDDDALVIGDKMGNIILYDQKSQRKLWKARAGAEILSIEKAEKGYLVSSGDNFVYLIADKNGKRLWKKRLAGKNSGTISRAAGIAVFATLNDEVASFLETNKGKLINQIFLEEDEYFINKPLISGNSVIFPTSKGLRSYSPKDCAQN